MTALPSGCGRVARVRIPVATACREARGPLGKSLPGAADDNNSEGLAKGSRPQSVPGLIGCGSPVPVRGPPRAGWRHSIEGTRMMAWSLALDMLEMETLKMFPDPLDRNNRNRQWRECQLAPGLTPLTDACAECGQCPVTFPVVRPCPHPLALDLQPCPRADTGSWENSAAPSQGSLEGCGPGGARGRLRVALASARHAGIGRGGVI